MHSVHHIKITSGLENYGDMDGRYKVDHSRIEGTYKCTVSLGLIIINNATCRSRELDEYNRDLNKYWTEGQWQQHMKNLCSLLLLLLKHNYVIHSTFLYLRSTDLNVQHWSVLYRWRRKEKGQSLKYTCHSTIWIQICNCNGSSCIYFWKWFLLTLLILK